MKLASNSRFVCWVAAALVAVAGRAVPAEFTQDAYVWQRAWTEAVTNSVATLAPRFGELVALRAEVTWEQRSPRLAEVALDYSALRSSERPVGLALRIGTFPGSFAADDAQTRWLSGLARSLVAEAESNGVRLEELQLDFDSADSKLDGYRVWVEAIRSAVTPTPVTITALPSWLDQAAFPRLAASADGYVLQVHSFERPKSADAPFQLCDPAAARRAVARAARLGRPFRVALPTYGYLVAFDRAGKFLGLSADGPKQSWPANASVREVWADPAAMAGLVRDWTLHCPTNLQGVIWYRLPVSGDTMNWRWPTLAAVMAGEAPKAELQVVTRKQEPGLVEIELANLGAADVDAAVVVSVKWKRGRLIAADGVRGFVVSNADEGVVRFRPAPQARRLAAGEFRRVGWMRLDVDAEVEASLTTEVK